jgi:uncharacterized protein
MISGKKRTVNPMSGPDRDGVILVRIAADEMSALADMHPHAGGGKPLDLDGVEYSLLAAGVTSGLDREAITEGIRAAEASGETARGIRVAVGKPAVNAVPLHFEYLVKQNVTHPTEGENVDYREPPRFPAVHKNDPLAVPVARTGGEPGLTVTGKEIPFEDAPDETLEAGDNVAVLGNGTYVARDDGRVIHDKGRIRVESALLVDADVDFSTGNIRFPKDVVVGGNVLDDFKVETNGSLVVKGVVGAAAVSARGPVEISGGFSGKGRGSVRSGAETAAAYVDNGTVVCLGDLTVANEIVNSNVRCNGKVTCLGKKGTILGGSVSALGGIECTAAGSPRSTETRLEAGVDIQAAARLAKAEALIARLGERIGAVDFARQEAAARGTAAPGLERERSELVKKLNELAVARETLRASLHPAGSPAVRIRARVYPGVVVSIMGVEKIVTAAAGPTTFVLDAEKKLVVSETAARPEGGPQGKPAGQPQAKPPSPPPGKPGDKTQPKPPSPPQAKPKGGKPGDAPER